MLKTTNTQTSLKKQFHASQAASINLKKSLMPDPEDRARPLNHHERKIMILKPEENIVQQELDRQQVSY